MPRPCTYCSISRTKAFDITAYGYIERQNSDKNIQELSWIEGEAILGESFLVQWLLFSSTVGLDEDQIRKYVKYQE